MIILIVFFVIYNVLEGFESRGWQNILNLAKRVECIRKFSGNLDYGKFEAKVLVKINT